MRASLLLLLCMACLAFTAQAAPVSAQTALFEQSFKRQDSGETKRPPGHHEHHEQHQHHHGSSKKHRHRHHHSTAKVSRKETRSITARGLKQAATVVRDAFGESHPIPGIEAQLKAKYAELALRKKQEEKAFQHSVEIEDALHVAKYGSEPSHFPEITRWASRIGLGVTLANVINIMFAGKTTALATTQFSQPPSPPTLLDNPGRWDGHQYRMMALPPESVAGAGAVGKIAKRDGHQLENRSEPDEVSARSKEHKRLIKRRKSKHPQRFSAAEKADEPPRIKKRWVAATIIGGLAGVAFSPGLPSQILGWKTPHEAPPFNPYDAEMLRPKNPLADAAARPGQPLPQLELPPSTNGDPSFRPLLPNTIRYPTTAYSPSSTANEDARMNSAGGMGSSVAPASNTDSTYGSSDLNEDAHRPGATGSEPQEVLRRRSVAEEAVSHANDGKKGHGANLKKRFIFGKGPWGKITGAVALGSIVPILWNGVGHARDRQTNPRDREILKELEQTPTYGAVGVPGRVPGQLATKAMPGYDSYLSGIQNDQTDALAAMEQQRLKALSSDLMTSRQQLSEAAGFTGASVASAAAVAQDVEPVLRKRDVEPVNPKPQSLLQKRSWMVNSVVGVAGGLLGYFQSATAFPQDRDEERMKRKYEQKKMQEAMAAQQAQMMGGQPGGGYPNDPSAMGAGGQPGGVVPGATYQPLDTSGYGPAPSDSGGSVGLPVQPLDYGSGGAGAGSVYAPSSVSAPGSGGDALSAYGSGGYSGGAMPSTGGGYASTGIGSGSGYGQGTGGSYAATAGLNAAAGYQSAGGSQAVGTSLKKRSTIDEAADETRTLSKRTPGFMNFLSTAGTAMFVGTLAGNLFVSNQQKDKPVPYVTPAPDATGPVPVGGDMYAAFLDYKRKQQGAGGAGGYGMGGGLDMNAGVPATTGPVLAGATAFGGAGGVQPGPPPARGPYVDSSQFDSGIADVDPSSNDNQFGGHRKRAVPEPGERLKKRSPLMYGLFTGTASADVSTAASALANKAPMIAEASTSAAASLSANNLGGLARNGAGVVSEAGAALPRFAGGVGGLTRGAASSEGAFAPLQGARGLTRTTSPGFAEESGGFARFGEGRGLTRSMSADYAPYSRFNPASSLPLEPLKPAMRPLAGTAFENVRPAMVGDVQRTGMAGAPATVDGFAGRSGGGAASFGGSSPLGRAGGAGQETAEASRGAMGTTLTPEEEELVQRSKAMEGATKPEIPLALRLKQHMSTFSTGASTTLTFTGAGG